MNKIETYVARGKELLDEKHHAYWEEIVPIRVGDLYGGMELDNMLDIIEASKTDDNKKTKCKKIFNDANHSGCSAGLVFKLLIHFTDDGRELVNRIDNPKLRKYEDFEGLIGTPLWIREYIDGNLVSAMYKKLAAVTYIDDEFQLAFTSKIGSTVITESDIKSWKYYVNRYEIEQVS